MFCILVLAACLQIIAGAYPPAPAYVPPKPAYPSPPAYTQGPYDDEYTTLPAEPSQEELDAGTKVCKDAYVECEEGVTRVGINYGAQFCQCGPNRRPYLQNCPPGTVFNDALSLCDYPPTEAAPTYAPYTE